MILPGSYANGFAPRDGQPLYPELRRGCIGAWAPCLGPTGLTLRDWSGRANHGTLTNMDPSLRWGPSGGKYALGFDGGNDSVDIIKSIVPTGSTSKTVCLWFKSDTTISTRQWLFYAGSETAYGRFAVEIESSKLNFNYFSQSAVHSTTLVASRWYHAAVVYTAASTSVTVYLDAVPQTSVISGVVALNTGTTTTTRFGVFNSGTLPFNGAIAELQIFDRVLHANEVAKLASKIGVMHEMVTRRKTSTQVAAAFNRRRRLLVGASS